MARHRMTATIDRDSVSPDSIDAANNYLTTALVEKAGTMALDWNSWRTYARRTRSGDMQIVQWVKTL